MEINSATIDALFYQINTLYGAAYERREVWSKRVSSLIPSVGRENRYAWPRMPARMREWIGERLMRNVETAGYLLANRDWELTEVLARNDIEDDQIGVFMQAIGMMADQAARLQDDLVSDVMLNGQTYLCFDGQAFFSTSHATGQPGSAATYQNYWSTAMPLNAANYNTVRAAMLGYVGEDGKPLRIQPNLLVVPPALEQAAKQILNTDFIAPAAAFGQNAASQMQSNTLKGTADLLVAPDLASDAGGWYLLDTTKSILPFVFQQRKAPTMVALTDPSSENLFMRKQYVYGVDARAAAGYSLPFLCAKAHS